MQVLRPQDVNGRVRLLVVEILPPGTRRKDERLKRDLVARGGVREYWLVDPDHDSIRVFRRDDVGRFPLVADLVDATALLTAPLLPGYSLPLRELFADS